jgi:hypothetical protein
MDPEDTKRLLEALTDARWVTREGWTYAPNATMWLNCSQPWHQDLSSFREKMMDRFRRLRHQEGAEDSATDPPSLVAVLDRLCPAAG